MEELKLSAEELLMIGKIQVPEILFNVKILHAKVNHSATVLPFHIIQRFQNLEKLFFYQRFWTGYKMGKNIYKNPGQAKTLVVENILDIDY